MKEAKIGEPKKEESRVMEALRRERKKMKELALTPEEKEELKALILESKDLEAKGKLAEAESKLQAVLDRMDEIRSKLAKGQGLEVLDIKNEEGETVLEFEMAKELEYWQDFYQEAGVDWINLPETIKLSAEDIESLGQGAKALCPDGNYEKLKLLIIPENLADTGEKYANLHKKMSEGYNESYQSGDFKEAGGFEKLKNKSDKLRVMLVKEVENLKDDELYKATLGKSVDDLEAKDGIFEQTGLRGIDMATYLVWQREYFKRTGQHLDDKYWTWLTEHERLGSGRVPDGRWDPDGARLYFGALDPGLHGGDLGCRLSSSREIVI